MSASIVCLALLLTQIAMPAGALPLPSAEPPVTTITTFQPSEPWRSGFEQIERDLAAGRWPEAAGAAGALANRMARLFPASREGRALVATALTMQAIAEVEAGRRDDALWHWQVAQNVDPELRRASLDTLGEAGAWLEAHRLRAPGTLDGEPPAGAVAPEARQRDEVTPPAPLSVPIPEPPRELGLAWASDRLEIEVVVDVEGRVRSPVLLRGGKLPGKVYFGLAALEQWRFRPALAAGVPVPALLRLDGLEPRSPLFAAARSPRLRPIHELLIEGRWQEARAAAQPLVGESLDCLARQPARGTGIDVMLGKGDCDPGMPLALRAAAEAGLGRVEGALWSWHLAYSFHPWTEAGGLAAYGPESGRLLATRPCAAQPEACGVARLPGTPGITAPKPISTPPLRLPAELWERADPGRFGVALWVDADGEVRGAWMWPRSFAAAGYHALTAVRDWRFEPARRDGEPVAVVFSATIPLAPAAPAEQVARWRREMDAVDRRLAAGEWRPAAGEASARVAEIAAAIDAGGSDLLARGVAQLALAEAGLDLAEEAVWHWYAAQNLALEYRIADLSAYGAAGELLDRHRLRRRGKGAGKGYDPDQNLPPRKLSGTMPRYPKVAAKAARGAPDVAVLELIIDQSGVPRAPVVLRGRNPARLLATLEALREWRFEPVLRDGLPVSALRRLTLPMANLRPLGRIALSPDAESLVRLATEQARRRPRIARCYWRTATNLEPALALVDPSTLSPRVADLAAPATGPRPLKVEGAVEKPRKIYSQQPRYTPVARKARIQGAVITQTVIDEEGHVTGLKVLKGLPHGLNVETAKAICRWRFEPATRAGEPVAVYYSLVTGFRLE